MRTVCIYTKLQNLMSWGGRLSIPVLVDVYLLLSFIDALEKQVDPAPLPLTLSVAMHELATHARVVRVRGIPPLPPPH